MSPKIKKALYRSIAKVCIDFGVTYQYTPKGMHLYDNDALNPWYVDITDNIVLNVPLKTITVWIVAEQEISSGYKPSIGPKSPPKPILDYDGNPF